MALPQIKIKLEYQEPSTFQVDDAVGLSTLIHKIQDERAAVALNIFLDRGDTFK